MWEKIKKILQKEGGKCIIIEENRPTYLVMKMKDYEKTGSDQSSEEETEIEKVNQDINELEAEEKEETELVEPDSQEVKIEDLPF